MNAQAEKVFERFLKTDFGKRLLAEADAEEIDVGKRKQTAAELAELKATRPEVMAKLHEANVEAQRAVDAAREVYEKAKKDAATTSRKGFSVAWQIDQRIREAEAFMLRTAPSALKQELNDAKDRLEKLKGQPVYGGPSFPDIPSGMGLSEANRPITKNAIKEREEELAGIEREIAQIQERILTGGL